MQIVEPEQRAPARVLVVMPFSDGAEQLAAVLRELGTQACELAQDLETALRRSVVLRPELVLIDCAEPLDAAVRFAKALRPASQAALVYLCDADTIPPSSLVSLCAGYIDKPITRARVLRCLMGLSKHGEADDRVRERSLDFRDELLASMAHELRAPLQGVSGFAQYLLEGKAGPLVEPQRSCLQQIDRGAEHVLQVIQDVLDLTDRSANTLQVRTEVVDTERAVREVLQVLQALAIRHRVGVAVSVDDRLGHVVCDATKLKQVFYNLLSNALKYTPPGGEVEVRLTRVDADSFCAEVSDTGPGLPAPLLSYLNSPAFGSSSAPVGRRPDSRGLGLTRRVVAALGGTLQAYNRAPSGAVLRVELPLAPNAVNPYSQL